MCGVRGAAVRRRHRPGRASLVHRADRDLGDHLVGAARPAADPARQAPRQTIGPVSVGTRNARLRFGRRGVALSRRGTARSGRTASLRDFQRGPAGHRAGLVQGRARSRAGRLVPGKAGRTRKTAGQRADDLHRIDAHSRVGLSVAFQHQQRTVLSAFRKARRSAVADAGVLDRLQYRDVSGQRGDKTPRRIDRDGCRRPVGRLGRAWRGARREPQHVDCCAIPCGRGLGLHADECDLGGSRDRR